MLGFGCFLGAPPPYKCDKSGVQISLGVARLPADSILKRVMLVRMRCEALVYVAALAAAPLLGQTARPLVRQFGLRNAASMAPANYDPLPVPGVGLARGSLFVVQGAGLGPAELVIGQAPYATQLPAEAGSHVSIRSLASGQVFEALLVHSWTYQVGGILPSAIPAGPAELTVAYGGAESEPVAFEIVEANPAIFAVSQDGFGPGVVQNYEGPADQPLNSLTRPAAPGQYLILWGTGLGAIEGDDNVPPIGNVRDDVTVRIGQQFVAPAAYAGRAPGLPGVDQINVRLPDDERLTAGCYVPIEIVAGAAAAGRVTVAISQTPGQCRHPLSFGAAKLAELDAGGTATLLSLNIIDVEIEAPPAVFGASTHSFVFADAAAANAAGVAQRSGAQVAPLAPSPDAVCGPGATWLRTGVFSSIGDVPPPPPPPPTAFPLDLGGGLELGGPGGREAELVRGDEMSTSYAPHEDLGAGFFAPGEWQVRIPGGAGIGATEIPFRIPSPLEIDLPDRIARGRDLELTWRGEDYLPGDIAEVALTVTSQNPEQAEESMRRSAIGCRAEASRGGFVIAAGDLDAIEVPDGAQVEWTFGVRAGPSEFSGPDIDYGRIDYSYQRRRAASFE